MEQSAGLASMSEGPWEAEVLDGTVQFALSQP